MSIVDLLEQTCDLYAPVVNADGNGLDSYGAAESEDVACYFEDNIQEIDTGGGQTEFSDGMMFFGADTTIDMSYKVAINSKVYRVMKLNPFREHGVLHHYEPFVKEISED